MSIRSKPIPTITRAELERRFPDDEARAEYPAKIRWRGRFRRPDCGSRNAVRLRRPRCARQCRDCRKRTSATAGTFLHRTRVPLKKWIAAIHLAATHSNGISAAQLKRQLGLGSDTASWLMLQKLRRAMASSEGALLRGFVEADETMVPHRRKGGPRPKPGRSADGKLLIAGAVELSPQGAPRRLKLRRIRDFPGDSLRRFAESAVQPGTPLRTDDWLGCAGIPRRDAAAVGDRPAREVMRWIHRAFSNLKRWAMGVRHGFREKRLDRCLAEFAFRWNRRRNRRHAFLGIVRAGLEIGHASCRDIVGGRA